VSRTGIAEREMMTNRVTVVSRCQQAMAIMATICLVLTAEAPDVLAQCKLGPAKVTLKRIGRCTMDRYSARVEDAKCSVEVSGDEFSCGRLRLGAWKKTSKQAVQICEESQRNSSTGNFYVTHSLSVVAQRRGLVSVDEAFGSFSGGAHHAAATTRRTYDTRRGREVSLDELLPGPARTLLARAKDLFDRRNTNDGFSWDPRAFAVAVKRGKTRIEFACPHQKEVHRGETLKVTVYTKRRPRRLRKR